jgi:hypothetical protein
VDYHIIIPNWLFVTSIISIYRITHLRFPWDCTAPVLIAFGIKL